MFGPLSFDRRRSPTSTARLGSTLVADPASAACPSQLGGRPAPLAPAWTAKSARNTQSNCRTASTLTPRIDYSYVGGQWATPYQDLGDFLAARNLVNADAGLRLRSVQGVLLRHQRLRLCTTSSAPTSACATPATPASTASAWSGGSSVGSSLPLVGRGTAKRSGGGVGRHSSASRFAPDLPTGRLRRHPPHEGAGKRKRNLRRRTRPNLSSTARGCAGRSPQRGRGRGCRRGWRWSGCRG